MPSARACRCAAMVVLACVSCAESGEPLGESTSPGEATPEPGDVADEGDLAPEVIEQGAVIAEVAATYEDAEGVVHYAFAPSSLPSAVQAVQLGVTGADGTCTFTGAGSGEPGSAEPQIIVTRELTFDPQTCTRRLATATYARTQAPALVLALLEEAPVEGEERDGKEAEESAPEAAELGPDAVWYQGSIKVNVEDPVEIDVTTTKSVLSWTGRSSLSRAKHNARWGWYTPSGWRRTNSRWSHDISLSRAYTNTFGRYKNGAFCAGDDTWTEHGKTYFEGRPGGGYWWSYRVKKWGSPCRKMLHYERIIEAP